MRPQRATFSPFIYFRKLICSEPKMGVYMYIYIYMHIYMCVCEYIYMTFQVSCIYLQKKKRAKGRVIRRDLINKTYAWQKFTKTSVNFILRNAKSAVWMACWLASSLDNYILPTCECFCHVNWMQHFFQPPLPNYFVLPWCMHKWLLWFKPEMSFYLLMSSPWSSESSLKDSACWEPCRYKGCHGQSFALGLWVWNIWKMWLYGHVCWLFIWDGNLICRVIWEQWLC